MSNLSDTELNLLDPDLLLTLIFTRQNLSQRVLGGADCHPKLGGGKAGGGLLLGRDGGYLDSYRTIMLPCSKISSPRSRKAL
jgi:hypothetical protein